MIKKLIRYWIKKKGLALVPNYKLSANRILSLYGYFNSIEERLPVDQYGNPLPWFTYSSIEFLSQFDLSECKIFEWGSGNSSLYFAERCKLIYSIEHDYDWYITSEKKKKSNQVLEYYNNYSEYVKSILRSDFIFDIIIIDGKKRFSCAVESLQKLKSNGLIILDNSDRYPDISNFLREKEFNQIDFFGIGPINDYAWCTSIFFKNIISLKVKNRQPKVTVAGLNELVPNDFI